jgi:hypothetical protein
LSVIICGCETFCLTLREEHSLTVFETRVLMKIFGPESDGEWRGLHNEKLHDLYFSQNIILMIK